MTFRIRTANLEDLLREVQTNGHNFHGSPSLNCDKLIAYRKNRDGSIPLGQSRFVMDGCCGYADEYCECSPCGIGIRFAPYLKGR